MDIDIWLTNEYKDISQNTLNDKNRLIIDIIYVI